MCSLVFLLWVVCFSAWFISFPGLLCFFPPFGSDFFVHLHSCLCLCYVLLGCLVGCLSSLAFCIILGVSFCPPSGVALFSLTHLNYKFLDSDTVNYIIFTINHHMFQEQQWLAPGPQQEGYLLVWSVHVLPKSACILWVQKCALG